MKNNPFKECKNYDNCGGYCESEHEIIAELCESCIDEEDIFEMVSRLEAQVIALSSENKELREDKAMLEFMIERPSIWIESDEGFSEVFDGGSQAISNGKTPREAIRAAMKGGE